MLEHKIYEGLSTTYTKEGHLLPFLSPTEELNYLLTTPQIIEVIIEASIAMLDPLVPEEYITVGVQLEFSHEQPTLVLEGGPITAKLTVLKVDGNKIKLDVKCYDEIGLIGQGNYERVIVHKGKLRESTYKRAKSIMI